jgi:hypothetical protein
MWDNVATTLFMPIIFQSGGASSTDFDCAIGVILPNQL